MPPEDEVTQGQEVVETPQPPVQETEPTRAPYADYLEGLPESVVPLVEPIFKKWDSDTGKRFSEVHSQYESVKPWKQFADAGIDPTEAEKAFILFSKLQENPEEVYRALGEAYNFNTGGQGQPQTQQAVEDQFVDPDDLENDPRFAGLQNMTRTMAEYLVAQEQQKQAALLDQQIDTELKGLREKYGDFDERYVLTQMMNGIPGDKAVESFNGIVESALKARQSPAAPTVMRSGGGVPSSPVDVSKASNKEVKGLVAQLLANAHQEN